MQNNLALSKTISGLQARGIGYETVQEDVLDENGNPILDKHGKPLQRTRLIVRSVPESEAEVNRFFVLSVPCWFKGCEELREEYKKALDDASQDNKPCTNCKKGAIMRMMEERVRLAINNAHTRSE